MGQITVNGRPVTVDDSFFSLSPEQQDATVDEIAASLPPAGAEQLSQLTQGAGAEAAPEQDQAAYDAQIQMNMRNQRAGEAYEALPGYVKPLQAASDMLTTIAHPFAAGATGIASMLSPGEYKSITPEMVIARLRTGKTEGPEFDAEVAKQKQATEDAAYRSGWAGIAGQVATGAMLPVAKIFGAGRPLLNLAATGAAGGGLVAAGSEENPLLGAAGGAAGALGGAALGKGISMAGDKLLGALGSPTMSNAISWAGGKLLNKGGGPMPVGALRVPPTAPKLEPDDFKSLASAAYDEAESHGVVFNKQGLAHLKNRIVKELTDKGYHPKIQPKIAAVLETIDDYLATGNATQRGMQTLREITSGAYDPLNKKNNMFVTKIIDEIDDLSDALNPRHMSAASGNPKAASEAAKYARLMYHKGAKLQLTQDLIEAGTQQGDTNISKNVRQAVRKKLATVTNPLMVKRGRGFSAAEKAGFKKAVKTTGMQDIAHSLSGLMPRDKLSSAVAAIPLLTGIATAGVNPLGALYAIGGTAARMGIGHAAEKWANRMAQKSVDDLVHLISTGQTTKQAAQSVLQKLTASKRAAVMQGLTRAGFALAASTQPLNEPEVSSRIDSATGRIGGML